MRTARDRSATESARVWRAGSREVPLDRPIVVGILNVTPDSFSDGGNFFSADSALEHAAAMIADGADIIDVGGESTRPGAAPVEAADEAMRVMPVIRAIRDRWPSVPISIDTVKSDVAAAALDAGADIVNDVSAMRLDPAMPLLVGKSGCGVVLMHSRGDVKDMATYVHATYENVVEEVMAELNSQLLVAEEAGVDRTAVVMDPGFGFSKKSRHSMTLLMELGRFTALDAPVMAGVSRKRFVREAMKHREHTERAADEHPFTPEDRDTATAAVNVMALERGAMLFRVHNVRVNRTALDAAWTILTAGR
ncbi:MAG: dihydropteroate synthase [Gemmatimonadaceae bacterium]|nr:dihydropteroate synthase [Gemmatimonadaceae bacterium]